MIDIVIKVSCQKGVESNFWARWKRFN